MTWVINSAILFYKRMPDSLEVLHIVSLDDQKDFECAVESVREMIHMHKESLCLPRLREIRLEAPFEGDGLAFGVLAVQQEETDVGIRLRKLDISAYPQSWIRGIWNPWEELIVCTWDYNGLWAWGNFPSDAEFLEID